MRPGSVERYTPLDLHYWLETGHPRGMIRPGMWADLTVFDRKTIALRSPDADPERLESFYPAGVHYVVVNGQVATEGHHHTGACAGKVLRK